VLNIGKLRAGSAAYYADTVATSEADYYAGRGEVPGRWEGSLAVELGLTGPVTAEQLQRLLHGLHPESGQPLVSAQGSNARAQSRRPTPAEPTVATGAMLDTAQVAVQLGVSHRAVIAWIEAGQRVIAAVQPDEPSVVYRTEPQRLRDRLAELADAEALPDGLPRLFLVAAEATLVGGGRKRWLVSQAEVDALAAMRQRPPAQAGWDVVLRPPKSVSLLWAVGGPDVGQVVAQIHHAACRTAVRYLEDAACRTRTTANGRTVRTAGTGFLIAAFDHRDSRAGDPLLHTHHVIANATRLPDGRWRTLTSRELYDHGRAADAVYQSTLRHLAAERLGLRFDVIANGWADIEGVPRHVIEHFSKRAADIDAELAEIGATSAKARRVATLSTRPAKHHDDATPESLHDRWRTEAADLGFGPDQIAALLHTPTRHEPCTAAEIDDVFDRLACPDGLTELAATFTRADVVTTLAGRLGVRVDGQQIVELADRFLASGGALLVNEHRPGAPTRRLLNPVVGGFEADLANSRYTTPELLTVEARLITLAEAPARHPACVPAAVVDQVLAERPELSSEQATMVQALTGDTAFLQPVVGFPGAGKTYATEAAVAAFRRAGVPVVGCAVTAEAADELARACGLRLGGGDSTATVGACDTLAHRDLDRLALHALRAGGQIKLIGDPAQHTPVGPGSFYHWLIDHEPARVVRLEANHRQRDHLDADGAVVSLAEERLATLEYRQGLIAESLARRDADGKVVRARTAGQLYDTLTTDWYVDWQAGLRDPMIATRNTVREELNRRARLLRKADGELSGPAVRTAGREFAVGDLIVARHNQRRLRTPDGWFVKNGSRGTVVDVDPAAGTLTVDFDGPESEARRVGLPKPYVDAHIEHGYAVTDYGVQGRTLGKGKAVLDDATTRPGAYVATTRGRTENRIYLVDGDVDRDPDRVHHGDLQPETTGLDALTFRLAGDERDPLLHEADPWAGRAAHHAGTLTLGQLAQLLAALDERLAEAPRDVTRALRSAEAELDRLQTEKRVLVDRIGDAQAAGHHLPGLQHDLFDVERSLDTAAGRLLGLQRRDAGRTHWFDEHRHLVDERHLLRDAERLREGHVRAAAVIDGLPGLDPPDPFATAAERAGWRNAVEQAALYRDRYGLAGDATDLGPPPDLPAARVAWRTALDAYARAAHHDAGAALA
jgi:conjugative relaxase-like TrwC/TraI family protein